MTPERIIRRYLEEMQAGNLDGVLSCFSNNAYVISPTYGQVAVRPFYERLFADTLEVKVIVHAIYQDIAFPLRWIAHFAYDWARRDGTIMKADLVDFFEFEDLLDRIAVLRIVVDTQQIT